MEALVSILTSCLPVPPRGTDLHLIECVLTVEMRRTIKYPQKGHRSDHADLYRKWKNPSTECCRGPRIAARLLKAVADAIKAICLTARSAQLIWRLGSRG
jgi:hypothetical protein